MVMVCATILSNFYIIPPSLFNHRSQYSFPLVIPFARTNLFKSSFFVSSAYLWNCLPPDIVCCSSLTKQRWKKYCF